MEKIRMYVDGAFRNVQQTKEVLDLKEELIGNLMEQYQDFQAQGLSDTEAYTKAIAGIGDLSELVSTVTASSGGMSGRMEQTRAVLIAVAALLCLLAPGCLLLFLLLLHSIGLGLFTMFVCFGIAAGLIVYVIMTRPRGMAQVAQTQRKAALEKLTGAASFSSVQAVVTKSQKGRAVEVSLEFAYWLLILALYLLVSFLWGIWSYSWLIFILALAIEQIVRAAVHLGGKKDDESNS